MEGTSKSDQEPYGSYSTPIPSDKEFQYAESVREVIDGPIQYMGTRKAYIDNTGKGLRARERDHITHVTRGGNRLSPDSESPENSDLTQISKRVPPLVF